MIKWKENIFVVNGWKSMFMWKKIRSCHWNNLISVKISLVIQDWESSNYRWCDFVQEIYINFFKLLITFLFCALTFRAFWWVALSSVSMLAYLFLKSLKRFQFFEFWHQNSWPDFQIFYQIFLPSIKQLSSYMSFSSNFLCWVF